MMATTAGTFNYADHPRDGRSGALDVRPVRVAGEVTGYTARHYRGGVQVDDTLELATVNYADAMRLARAAIGYPDPDDADTLDAMTRGFVMALLWSDAIPINYEDRGETGGLEHREATAELTDRARFLCARFMIEAGDDIAAHMDAFPDPDGGHPGEYVGHTFYLDAAGHGVSFTDRAPLLNPSGSRNRGDAERVAMLERLRLVAHQFPEVEHLCAYELPDGTVGL